MLADVLGQKPVAEKFLTARRLNHLGQGYILSGPEGIGKTLFAVELAKTLLCRESGDDACERCPSCRKVQHGNHEDIDILEPTGRGRMIHADEIEKLIERLQYKTRSGEQRFVILRDADRMNTASANHFLKTLEEPPTDVTFFLLTARMNDMLDTIISRCQVVRMRRAAAEDVEQFLQQRGYSPDKARLFAALCDGCPGRAINMEEAGVYERREQVLNRMMNLQRSGAELIAAEMLAENKAGRNTALTRENHYADLGLMAALMRDMTLIAEGADASILYNPDAADRLQSLAAGKYPENLRKNTLSILEARKNIEKFTNPDLVITQLFTELSN